MMGNPHPDKYPTPGQSEGVLAVAPPRVRPHGNKTFPPFPICD
jgi:hypothetical protein